MKNKLASEILHSYILENEEDSLCHFGIFGMRWGIRRFQPYPKGYKGSGKEIGEAKKEAEARANSSRSSSSSGASDLAKKQNPKDKYEMADYAAKNIIAELGNKGMKGYSANGEGMGGDLSVEKSTKTKDGKSAMIWTMVDGETWNSREKELANGLQKAEKNSSQIKAKAIDTVVDDAYEYMKDEGLTKQEIKAALLKDMSIYVASGPTDKYGADGTISFYSPNVMGGHIGECEWGFTKDGKLNISKHVSWNG